MRIVSWEKTIQNTNNLCCDRHVAILGQVRYCPPFHHQLPQFVLGYF